MSDLANDGVWIDSGGLEHEEEVQYTKTYDSTQPHFWRQLGHTDAMNGVPHRTINPNDYPTGTIPDGVTGATLLPVVAGYQGFYDDGFDEGKYDLLMLGQEGGNTPVEGI